MGGKKMAGHQLFVFKLDDKYFGIDLESVNQIIPYRKITKIPNMPAYIEGIIPLRDNICTVFNLRKKFNLPAREADESTRIVIANVNSEMIGIIADNTNEIVREYDDKTVVAHENGKGSDEKYIKGTADIGENHITIIDLSQLVPAA
ncbi:hypothetical protein CDQ83_11640 [Clostridium thermosuccinogenes]|nr:hypothetical protein CDQ83_11640 [Pseudoclostridium thermosuccinogenes]